MMMMTMYCGELQGYALAVRGKPESEGECGVAKGGCVIKYQKRLCGRLVPSHACLPLCMLYNMLTCTMVYQSTNSIVTQGMQYTSVRVGCRINNSSKLTLTSSSLGLLVHENAIEYLRFCNTTYSLDCHSTITKVSNTNDHQNSVSQPTFTLHFCHNS